MNGSGPARSENIGSVRNVTPSIRTRNAECPTHVMVGLRAIARLSYGTRAAAPGRRTNAAQILRIKKPAVGAPGEGADFPRAKATTARTITEPRISTTRRSIRTGRRRSRRGLDPRREQLVHHRRHDPREQ